MAKIKTYSDIQMISVEQIVPYWNNPRQNELAVKALKRSIRRYGFNQPILVDKNYVIIKGHARYEACKQLGMESIPAIISTRSDHVNDADRVLYNSIHDLTKWDKGMLEFEMRDVEDALEAVLGESQSNTYSDVSFNEYTSDQVVWAKEQMTQHPEREYITVVCECGEEMLLAKDTIMGLI